MSSQPSSSKPQGVTKCRYTTSALSKRAIAISKQGSTRGIMADNGNAITQAQADRLLMPPPRRPDTPRRKPKRASPNKTKSKNTGTVALRSRKNKDKDEPEPVATTTETTTKTTKKEDDLPSIEPLTEEEKLLFHGIEQDPIEQDPRPIKTMTPEEGELWRELEPQAGDRMLTVDEVDKMCDDFYKEL
ncbi:hypothetical protein N0V84_005918 [Fusarium piperis]|uniref:Uncharacterized protein n=1 Tax=Fusarium piperis TaxID=1435070 RepID=A0A9W8WCT4_9HYPO|nr:hypothetical protein N0V84_005918 [Fusarium piperis]